MTKLFQLIGLSLFRSFEIFVGSLLDQPLYWGLFEDILVLLRKNEKKYLFVLILIGIL